MKTPLGLLEFQNKIRGAVRPNIFTVTHNWPAGIPSKPNKDFVAYMCKSAALPATNVGTVELPFRGRVVKVPGDRTYETWTATFYNDDGWALRSAYEKWIQLTNGVDTNTATADISQTFENITIAQLDKFGGSGAATGTKDYKTLREYVLVSAWPVSVSQISVAYDNNDSYEEFDVEFAYQYHESTDGASNNIVSKDTDG